MVEYKKNKKSMEIEAIPSILNEEIQHELIDQILARKDIGRVSKAYLIRSDINIVFQVAFCYLKSKGFNKILTHLKRPDYSIPAPKSASKWSSKEEFEYYLINIIDEPDENKFGSDELKDLPLEIESFISTHSNNFMLNYNNEMENRKVKNCSTFATMYFIYMNETNRESNIDNLLGNFLENVLGKDFPVLRQMPLRLKVNELDCEAISDVCVIDGISNSICIIVVEDKTEKNKEGDPIAHLVADGIAVAEQSYWKEEWPIYMVLCKGLNLSFFKGTFSKQFLSNVRNGYDCTDNTFIYHLSEKNSKISLEFEDGRRKAAKIFSKIKVECIQRRNL